MAMNTRTSISKTNFSFASKMQQQAQCKYLKERIESEYNVEW